MFKSRPPFAVPDAGAGRAVGSYVAAAAAVSLATVSTIAIRGIMGTSVSILFFPAVLFSAISGGYGPALLATVLSTSALAYFFISPFNSFDIGADDLIRLGACAVVAIVTASISSARKRAEDAQRKALVELRGALGTLQKVSGWPVFVDVSLAGAASKLLAHAASVVPCERTLAIWEADDEPWVYLAASDGVAGGVVKQPPASLSTGVPAALEHATFVSADPIGGQMRVAISRGGALTEWHGRPLAGEIASRLTGRGLASAPFEVERLSGRLFCSGLGDNAFDLAPLVDVVAHEVGNSLERLYLHDRLQQVAVREERIRVARDLHDGVLQSLTGVRLRLQALADTPEAAAETRDSLLAVERALAIEQRELRLFIEDLKPMARPAGPAGAVARVLEELRDRLALEWNTPIVVRVTPEDLSIPAPAEQTVRLLVREAVVNALKHAQPSRVSVEVSAAAGNGLQILVANDGRGFPFRGRLELDELAATNAGPVSLRERLQSVGGSLAIDSTTAGSRVEMTLPV